MASSLHDQPKRSLRIGIITPGYRPGNSGLVRQVELLAHGLKVAGHQVTVFVTIRALDWVDRLVQRVGLGPSAGTADLPAERDVEGIRVLHFSALGWEHVFPALPLLKAAAHKLGLFAKTVDAWVTKAQGALQRRIARRSLERLMDRVDVLHIHDKYAWQILAMDLAALRRKPFVVTPYLHFGGSTQNCPPSTVSAINRGQGVLALLPTEAAALRILGVTPGIRVSGIAVGPLPEAPSGDFRARHGIGPGPIVLFVGRLVGYKGVFHLLDAQLLVSEARSDVHLVFVGPDRSEFCEQLRLHSAPNVHYLGELDEPEKIAAIDACALVCLPSTDEVFPTSMAEAWTLSRAVIGGPAYGLRELVEGNGAGVVCEQAAPDIATAILRLLSDDTGREEMGRRGRALMSTVYSDENYVRESVAAYRDACSLIA